MSKLSVKDNVPAFLIKLWQLLEDEKIDDIICWSQDGSSFVVQDHTRFARELLPKYFKHSNFASFVRQLNMYDFHKVFNAEQGGLIANESWIFHNKNFKRGHPELLKSVKRKVSHSVCKPEQTKIKSEDIDLALNEIHIVKSEQENINNKFERIKLQNKLLWNEILTLRKKHHMQQQIVQKLTQFLLTFIYEEKELPNRRKRLMLQDGPNSSKMRRTHYDYDQGNGGPADELDVNQQYYVNYPSTYDSTSPQINIQSATNPKEGALVAYPDVEGNTAATNAPPISTTVDNDLVSNVYASQPAFVSPVASPTVMYQNLDLTDYQHEAAVEHVDTNAVSSLDQELAPSIPLLFEPTNKDPDTAYIGECVDTVQESLDQLQSLLADKDVNIAQLFDPEYSIDESGTSIENEPRSIEELLESFTKDGKGNFAKERK